MEIHEYQAKELLTGFGVPVPRGGVAYSAEQAVYRAAEIGGTFAVATGANGAVALADPSARMLLYRPVGLEEARLIYEADMRVSSALAGAVHLLPRDERRVRQADCEGLEHEERDAGRIRHALRDRRRLAVARRALKSQIGDPNDNS